jgi:TRAP-type C4-dicarboxylate transport system substrate-binding protein
MVEINSTYRKKETPMIAHRKLYLLVVIVGLIVTACAPQAIATPNPTAAPVATAVPATVAVPDKPITLHLAVSDSAGRPSEPYVREFVDQVNTLSKGNITIVPVWDAGIDMTPCCEQGVVKLVKDGQDELGLAPSRPWDTAGVTSFQALQAPFLITDNALAEAVAASDIGTRMLDGLSSAGMTGLALWPEDLRHPFSYVSGKSILSPDDLKGLAVRTPSSEVSFMLMKAFGGKPFFDNETKGFPVSETGLFQVASSPFPTVTGNVIFYPKFQVLFANGTAFEKLSEGQRSILRQAAAAAQKKAIAAHPSEADAAHTWCNSGGTIVAASQEQLAAFEAAAKPVFDQIEKDPLNAKLIADIRELKANTKPAPGAEACQPAATTSEVWSTGLPPNGTWQAVLSAEDFVRMGMAKAIAESTWAGTYTWTFQDGKGQLDYKGPGGDFICLANMEFVDNVARFSYYNGDACNGSVEDINWRLDPDGLHLHLVAAQNEDFRNNMAQYEAKPWQEVANP